MVPPASGVASHVATTGCRVTDSGAPGSQVWLVLREDLYWHHPCAHIASTMGWHLHLGSTKPRAWLAGPSPKADLLGGQV